MVNSISEILGIDFELRKSGSDRKDFPELGVSFYFLKEEQDIVNSMNVEVNTP